MVPDFNKLIAEFSKIHKQLKNEPTFLEISGYPHYENVCSNILAFFLNPQKEHGLSDLLLRSIMECEGKNHFERPSNVKIEREAVAESGRIDLVITSDTHIIAIENKIYHHTDGNPFDAYIKKIETLAGERNKIFILLGLNKIIDEKATKAGFQSITYQQVFTKVRINLGEYIVDANNKYLVFFLEFMKSIENLIRGYQMDSELIKFFNENQKDVQSLVSSFNKLKDEFRLKVTELRNHLRDDFAITEQEGKVKQTFYRVSGELWDSLVYDITVEDNFTVVADCSIHPHGLEIEIYVRGETPISWVEEFLKEKIAFLSRSDGKLKFNMQSELNFDASIENVANKYGVEVLRKILE